MKKFPVAEIAVGVVIVAGLAVAGRQIGRERAREAKPDTAWKAAMVASYVPTPDSVVDAMLALTALKRGDVLYDLGSGDGRIVVNAAKRYGVRAVGYEIDPELIAYSREWIRRERLDSLAEIRDQDLFTADLSPASVVTLFLLKKNNLRLMPALKAQLKPGSRVASHMFDMGDAWKPDSVVKVGEFTLFLWHVR